jgi:hypothetical protein
MIIFVAYVFFTIVVAIAARRWFNRSAIGWFCIGLLVSPIFSFPLLLALAPLPKDAPKGESDWNMLLAIGITVLIAVVGVVYLLAVMS